MGQKLVDLEIGLEALGVFDLIEDANKRNIEFTGDLYNDKRAQDAVGNILVDSASVDFTYDRIAGTITADVIAGGVHHGGLAGLGDDDHTQYALLAGRAGGQTLIGGTASGDDLTFESTSHASKGNIVLLDKTLIGSSTDLGNADALEITGTTYFSGHIGIGTFPPDADNVVRAAEVFTHTTGIRRGMLYNAVHNPVGDASAASSTSMGFISFATGTGHIGQMKGVDGVSIYGGSNLIDSLVGGLYLAQMDAASSGVATNMVGVVGGVSNISTNAADSVATFAFQASSPLMAGNGTISGVNIGYIVNNQGHANIANAAGIILDETSGSPGINRTMRSIGGMIDFNTGQTATGDFLVMGQTDADLLWVKVSTNRIGIGTPNPSAQLHTTQGRIVGTTRFTSGPQTLDETHHIVYCDTDGGAWTLNLPAGIDGTEYRIINVGGSGNDLTIDPNGSETLLGFGAGVSFDLVDSEALILHYETTEGWW